MSTKRRKFLPLIHSLEERINLSFSLSSVVHSLFPFVPDNSTKAKSAAAVKTQAATALTPAEAAAHPRLAAVREARLNKVMGHPSTPVVKAVAHPKGAFNWYGPKLGSPTVRAR